MDYEALRGGLEAAIPFNKHVGFRVAEVGPGLAVVTLPEADHLRNHVGSQHAAALFSAGETASGGAFVGAFAERLGSDRETLLSALDADGVVRFPVEVELTDGEG